MRVTKYHHTMQWKDCWGSVKPRKETDTSGYSEIGATKYPNDINSYLNKQDQKYTLTIIQIWNLDLKNVMLGVNKWEDSSKKNK